MLPSGPSEPIVKDVKSIKRGLDISWSTDVTSKQEKYLVVYTRNDTKQSVNIETTEKEAKLRELYPGAEYKIQVMAGSENIQSDKKYFIFIYQKYLGSGCVSRSAVLAAHDAHGGAAQPAHQPRDQQSAGQHRQPQLGPAHRLPLHRLPHPVQTRAGKNIWRIAQKYLTDI